MFSTHAHETLEEASSDLLSFALAPQNWVMVEPGAAPPPRAPEYERSVGSLRVLASVDVRPNLETYLRVAFRAPGLNPMRAADHLEQFLKSHLPLIPNSEWQVELDKRAWIHFIRPYTLDKLTA